MNERSHDAEGVQGDEDGWGVSRTRDAWVQRAAGVRTYSGCLKLDDTETDSWEVISHAHP